MEKNKILAILIILILTIGLLTLTGCAVSKYDDSSNTNKASSEEKKKESLEANVDDLTISLNYSGSFNGISYKYPSKATTSNIGTYSIMDYMNGSEFIFRVAMYYFENKTLNQAMEGSSTTSKGKK